MKAEDVSIGITIALSIAALLLIFSIVRDVLPMLSAEDQAVFMTWRLGRNSNTNRAISNAWKMHVEAFPKSLKRLGFGCLVIATFLSVMGYPMWRALGPR